jgi:hypothetical protein
VTGADPRPSGWVRVKFPPEFRPGARDLAARCGWRLKEESAGLLVCTDETYRKTVPRLLIPMRLANRANASDMASYERLARWVPQDQYDPGTPLDAIMAEVEEHKRAATPERVFYALQLALFTAPDSAVPELVRRMSTNCVLHNYPEASVWAVEVAPLFHRRMAALRALFAVEAVPEVVGRGPDLFRGFDSGRGLTSNTTVGFEPYIHPALPAVSPWALGLTAARLGGAIVFLFGDPVLGLQQSSAAAELLQLYRPRFGTKRVCDPDVPSVTAAQAEAFFAWWVDRLNQLFALILDPARFATEDGAHDPTRQFAAVLSLERLFACVQVSLAMSHRDDFTRQTLLFETLDLLEGLRAGSVEPFVTLAAVEKRVAKLEAELPVAAVAVALPRCRAATAALADVATGFYVTERVSEAGVRRRTNGGGWETLSTERASAAYLRLLRNAAHSFMRQARKPEDLSLLAAHNGVLHPALPDLAFLHVLYLLHDLTTLRC